MGRHGICGKVSMDRGRARRMNEKDQDIKDIFREILRALNGKNIHSSLSALTHVSAYLISEYALDIDLCKQEYISLFEKNLNEHRSKK